MGVLEQALELVRMGFYVFPLGEDSKEPQLGFEKYSENSTRDENVVTNWFKNTRKNVAISTHRFGDEGECLIAVDVDVKDDKQGDKLLRKLELEGHFFPRTFTQLTPTGGSHLVYKSKKLVRSGVNVLGKGLDIRSYGGYLVGMGSSLGESLYMADLFKVADAPSWLIAKCQERREKSKIIIDLSMIDQGTAIKRAQFYLENEAPLAVEGDAGDQTTFKVAARVKDYGVAPEDCLLLMDTFWNERCSPPWNTEDLKRKIDNAYRYGIEPPGVLAPETQFTAVEGNEKKSNALHPFEELNKEYAFVLAGGGHNIIWETRDADGTFIVEHLQETTFHRKLAAKVIEIKGKEQAITKLWMTSPQRRSFDGFCFKPGNQANPKWYNLFRGFAYEPKPIDERSGLPYEALQMFIEHIRSNIANHNDTIANWIIGYFAHLVQKPSEKPLTALVFRGRKGVGKTAPIERVGALLGQHFTLVADSRYLTGNFNSHFENCLMIALDEAFWGGDKKANSILKHLVTGKKHRIERKGQETYSVDNLTRVCIMGNEDWLVPASEDERRYGVFDVNEGRKKDRKFFKDMRIGMENGGYHYLHQYLLNFDLSCSDIDDAPETAALLDQKTNGLDLVSSWWFECLRAGHIVGSSYQDWFIEVDKEVFRKSFYNFADERRVMSVRPSDRMIFYRMKRACPSFNGDKRKQDGRTIHFYRFPNLTECRSDFSKFLGQEVTWPKTE